ncbi:MAG TPA: D-alanyl-D-alanine carboxypeptidase/D-alanyl-D-alanine-endopeptidase [Solirubrobacterales bacterium]|nr:D-alanyl-D-alanine carboxypeptidase/D-alanyl-D-alanine-endopeptidase [Solirubrobacterales bacterium]
MKRAAILLAAACAVVLLLAVGTAQASKACDQMRSWLREGGGAASGLIVVEAESGEVVCGSAMGRQRSLASNMKMFTTATALAKLGPETRIATKVFGDGKLTADGVFHGSLYLQGGGDPALGTPSFYDSYLSGVGTNLYELKGQIKAAGITSITGRLYADDSIFDHLRGVADSGYATSSEIGPLSGLDFNSGFAGSSAASGFSSDPAKLAATKLARSLIGAGVKMPPKVALGVTPANAKRLAIVQSPPLSQITHFTDVYSYNFFAEMLIKLIGAEVGTGGTTAAGAAVISAYANSLGSGVHAVDGSGLTRSNRASPRQLADFLLAMREQEIGETFIDGLAVAGKEGTVDGRMRGTQAYGRCHVKTGTLTGVSNLSGYCFNASGRTMVFSVLMNGVSNLSLAHLDQDRIAGLVASY